MPNWVAAACRDVRHRERQPERAPGVERIQHAVVPEPRRGVERPPLPLELVANRRLQAVPPRPRSRLPPARSSASRLMVASTLAACSPPITEVRAFGH